MKYIDMHCDTLMSFAGNPDFSLWKNQRMIDIPRLVQGGCGAQFFAMFFPPELYWQRTNQTPIDDETYLKALSTGFFKALEEHSDVVAFAGNGADINRNLAAGKLSALLTLEDGRIVGGTMEGLQRVYDLGVRLISLTWNFENCFGFPNSADPDIMNAGLKAFGLEAVEEMNRLGILVDVSHLSDGGFYDVARVTKKPFVASHSNCRAICSHRRNLTDDMIRKLADCGGVSGINFASDFLAPDGAPVESTVENMILHIKHFIDVGGYGCVGIGTDLDGIELPLEIDSCDKMPKLFDALSAAGFSDDRIEQIAWGNVRRVIDEAL